MRIKSSKPVFHGACLLLMLLLGQQPAANAHQTLRVLAWPGYADPEVMAIFERRFDVFAVNTAELPRYIGRNLAIPIGIGHIPNHKNQLPRFQNPAEIPGLMHDGKLYGIPYTYSEIGLIYNRKTVKTFPTSRWRNTTQFHAGEHRQPAFERQTRACQYHHPVSGKPP